MPGSAAVFPVIADNGSVLISASQVVNGVSIRAINLYNNQLSTAETIAITSANGFTQLGNSPGISDDGNIVTFYGELNSGGASALNTNPGKGIFAAINTTSGWKIQRIAGIAGNGYLDPGETFQDTNNNGKFDTGEVDIGAFSDFDPNARVAVNSTQDTQRAVTIAYIANDIPININGINVSQKGLYTNRLNFFGSGAASFNAMDSGNEYTVNNPTLVTEVGDTIPELGTEPVKDLNIYDPLNSRDRGDVAFWVKTSTSEAVVRARSQAVVFLDFEPQKLPLPTEVEQIFNSYEIQPTWSGNTQLVFNTFGRPDITLSDIRDKIVKRVQDVFDAVGANVKVLGRSTDTLPTDDLLREHLLAIALSVISTHHQH